MAQVGNAGPASPGEDPLRLVMFGAPSAGKSSLLGALVQAARKQESGLSGQLVDHSQQLTDLHQRVYENRPQPTVDEVVSFPISLEPGTDSPKEGARVEAVLVDCAGRSAKEMLARQPALKRPDSSLAREIAGADSLILVVDGAAEDSQLKRDFVQLANFVRILEQNRSRQSEIAGLPVYLVLSKCDLLAKKSDTTSTWIQRIEERKRKVDQAFKEFLAQQSDRENLAFGKIDLHLWATAVGKPALSDRPASPQEPFGVAELFRQCLQDASRFHRRRLLASRRLHLTVAGLAGLIAAMLLLALSVFLMRPSTAVIALENALHGLLPHEGAKPADRLKDPLDDKLKQLRRIQKNPDFSLLPSRTQENVGRYVREIEAYQKFNKEFLEKVQDPRFASTEEELGLIEKAVRQTPLPRDYQATWKDTRVGRRPQLWLNDIKILRLEAVDMEKWLERQIQEGKEREKEGFGLLAGQASTQEREKWLARYQEYMERSLPHRPGERPAGAAGITYDTVYRFEPVQKARQDWSEFKKSLEFVYQRLRKQA